MRPLEVSPDVLRTLVEVASSLATDYWVGIDSRPAAPQVRGVKKVGRFRCEWNDASIGVEVLSDSLDIAERAGTTHGRSSGYVLREPALLSLFRPPPTRRWIADPVSVYRRGPPPAARPR